MKLKSILKYQLSNYKIAFLVYYCIFIFGSLSGTIMVSSKGAEVTVGGPEVSGFITFFIIGICMFGENFNFLAQHGNSRKSICKGRFVTTLLIAALAGVVDQLAILFVRFMYHDQTNRKIVGLLEMGFPKYFENAGLMTKFGLGFLCSFFGIAAFSMIGNLIATYFYRGSKAGRIAIAAGLPIFTVLILPLTFEAFAGSKVIDFITRVIRMISGTESGNPFCFLGMFLGLFALSSFFSYLGARRIQVKAIY